MTGFQSPLITRYISAERKQLEADLVYLCSNGTTYTVPKGFYTDGASVPRPLWMLYPPFGEAYEAAAVLHDFLYAKAEQFYGTDKGHISRAEADGIFYEAMKSLNYRTTGREVIYY